MYKLKSLVIVSFIITACGGGNGGGGYGSNSMNNNMANDQPPAQNNTAVTFILFCGECTLVTIIKWKMEPIILAALMMQHCLRVIRFFRR